MEKYVEKLPRRDLHDVFQKTDPENVAERHAIRIVYAD
jgi:hypothetical protein